MLQTRKISERVIQTHVVPISYQVCPQRENDTIKYKSRAGNALISLILSVKWHCHPVSSWSQRTHLSTEKFIQVDLIHTHAIIVFKQGRYWDWKLRAAGLLQHELMAPSVLLVRS